ncbi:MAG: Rieske 2Fe-2S domain-containing protein [Actinomycetota bacterium]|nr:Rieske 2Fe-2S domain-containing protein [Actinomycetota bacterium]
MSLTDTLHHLVERVATTESVDQVGKPVSTAVAKGLGGNRTLKDALSGTWLGHPLHPMLTDIPIGSWTSAFVLDLVGGERGHQAADMLIGIGILSALPTAAAGLSDWADTYGEELRIGTVHALANVTALSLYSLSWLARRRGSRGLGVTLGFLGATAATAGGYLGGHLVYRKGVGPDRNAWKHGGDDWVVVADEASIQPGEPQVVGVGDDEVLLTRAGSELSAISNVCGHAGGPLSEGSFDDEPGCVTCPWHGSVFRLADGHLVHGPATGHQPRYEVRTDGGKVSLRRARTTV